MIATQIRIDVVVVVAVAVGVVAVVAVAVAKCVHVPCIYLYVKHMPLCMHLYAKCMHVCAKRMHLYVTRIDDISGTCTYLSAKCKYISFPLMTPNKNAGAWGVLLLSGLALRARPIWVQKAVHGLFMVHALGLKVDFHLA